MEMKIALRNMDSEMLGLKSQENKSMVNKFWSDVNQEIYKIFDGSRHQDSTIISQ